MYCCSEKDYTERYPPYLKDQLLDFGPKRVFALWRGRRRDVKVEFLLGGGSDVGEEVGEVLGGL